LQFTNIFNKEGGMLRLTWRMHVFTYE
jgi:hypothetical protein